MNIVIAGLGLIGGSMAKALSLSGKHRITAFDTNEDVLLDAMSSGIIEGKAINSDLKTADVVYVCLYPRDVVEFVREHRKDFGINTVVSDVCGIKSNIYSELRAMAQGFTYVGAHPMAGKENIGFSSSEGSLFTGASYILIKEEDNRKACCLLEELASEMGFGRIVYTTSSEHDRMIAYTSQLPHVIACSYVMSPNCRNHKGFSAGSYRDVSRVAKINEDLWTDLFLSNGDALIKEIDTLTENIGKIRNAVSENDSEKLRELLASARHQKEIYG